MSSPFITPYDKNVLSDHMGKAVKVTERAYNTSFITTDLIAWYKAANVTKDGSNLVSEITDMSGNGHHLVQATASKQPVWTDAQLNGHPVLNFDGNDDLIEVAFGTTYARPNTIFVVFNIEALTGWFQAIYQGGTTNGYTWAFNTEQLTTNGGAGNGGYLKPAPFGYMLETTVMEISNDKMYENGVLKNSENLGNGGVDGMGLGSTWAPNVALDGNIAELLFYSRQLTTAERETVEAYLMNKYDL